MSWSRGGFFGPSIEARTGTPATVTLDAGLPVDPRSAARAFYARGDLDRATETQAAILGSEAVLDEDFLFMGLLHHAAGRIAEGIAVLREGLRRHAGNAPMHENLAVLLLVSGDPVAAVDAARAALALGSASPNLHDCLCEAYESLGRTDLAVQEGRLALEAKDRRFGSAEPLVRMPRARPVPFDPALPGANVIAYSLWGNAPRYQVPLMENARIQPHLFPGWTMRVYHDHTVETGYLAELAARGVELRAMALPRGVPAHRGLLWRFEPIADPAVQRFLIRDADSLLTVKERVAVDAWLVSARHFHAMRDWYTHTDLILAGMWGGVGGILPTPAALLRAYSAWRLETDHIDQDLLTETVWPSVRASILVHDSIFHPCLGSVPFPPYGAAPPGHHIGQNSFLLFSKSG
jgi:hypothetical protein